MKLVVIVGPYRSESDYLVSLNIEKAFHVSACLWELGYAVICPHKNSEFLSGLTDEQTFLNGYLEMVKRADGIVLIEGFKNSVGAMKEFELAKSLDKEILIYKNGRIGIYESD